MNWVFWFLIILFLVCLWFCLGIIFKPLGGLINKIFSDTMDNILESEENK